MTAHKSEVWHRAPAAAAGGGELDAAASPAALLGAEVVGFGVVSLGLVVAGGGLGAVLDSGESEPTDVAVGLALVLPIFAAFWPVVDLPQPASASTAAAATALPITIVVRIAASRCWQNYLFRCIPVRLGLPARTRPFG